MVRHTTSTTNPLRSGTSRRRPRMSRPASQASILKGRGAAGDFTTTGLKTPPPANTLWPLARHRATVRTASRAYAETAGSPFGSLHPTLCDAESTTRHLRHSSRHRCKHSPHPSLHPAMLRTAMWPTRARANIAHRASAIPCAALSNPLAPLHYRSRPLRRRRRRQLRPHPRLLHLRPHLPHPLTPTSTRRCSALATHKSLLMVASRYAAPGGVVRSASGRNF